jgi:hypothetical protein
MLLSSTIVIVALVAQPPQIRTGGRPTTNCPTASEETEGCDEHDYERLEAAEAGRRLEAPTHKALKQMNVCKAQEPGSQ